MMAITQWITWLKKHYIIRKRKWSGSYLFNKLAQKIVLKCHNKIHYHIHWYLYDVEEHKFGFSQIFQIQGITYNIFAESDTSLKYLDFKNEMNDVTLFYGWMVVDMVACLIFQDLTVLIGLITINKKNLTHLYETLGRGVKSNHT